MGQDRYFAPCLAARRASNECSSLLLTLKVITLGSQEKIQQWSGRWPVWAVGTIMVYPRPGSRTASLAVRVGN